MRLSRTNANEQSGLSSTIDLLATGDLDLLQLDFKHSADGELEKWFLEALQNIHKFFFLDPKLRLITNAGGKNVTARVESLGKYLREHGDSQMPITAVRGDNILARLPELLADGLQFVDQASGEPIAAKSHGILSAQVLLGAGPLATALADDSRMIVAGSYDRAAPFLAAGVALGEIAWDEHDALSQLAVAAEVSSLTASVTELSAIGGLTLQPRMSEPLALSEALAELKNARSLAFSDVSCDFANLDLVPQEHHKWSLDGIVGTAPTGEWQVRFILEESDGSRRECYSSIPRDAIPLSVDTRPAAEWL